MDIVKTNIYYYIDNIVKSIDDKYTQKYVFDIKMKLIHVINFNDFETFLHKEKKHVEKNTIKTNILNAILEQIQIEKQNNCSHVFSQITPNPFLNNENITWKIKCDVCNIFTSDMQIKIRSSKNNKYPCDNDLFKFFELCEEKGWTIK